MTLTGTRTHISPKGEGRGGEEGDQGGEGKGWPTAEGRSRSPETMRSDAEETAARRRPKGEATTRAAGGDRRLESGE
jgi:hypothetical protein